MGKKQLTPSSDNPFDLIAQVTLSVKDDKSDDPCRLRLVATSYNADLERGIVIPNEYLIRVGGECREKKKPYVDVLSKLAKFIKINSKLTRNIERKRKLAIALMVEAYKENPDGFDIKFKVIPVRGNKADYAQIYEQFEIENVGKEG